MQNSRIKTKTDGVNYISLPEVVGRGYASFWRSKHGIRAVKGGRASKKSRTAAFNHIVRLLQYKLANILTVRKVFRTLKDSCFAEYKWVINRLGLNKWFDIKESPLEITYAPTGQKILFRGLDDPLKITSIAVEKGVLCWCWIEEAYEITREDDFDILNESIRGHLPNGLFKQITLTFNPWTDKHWLKKRFFDEKDPNVFTLTTNYTCNEWLSEQDLMLFEKMKIQNPRRYQVAGLGNWGIVEGLVYENFEERFFDVDYIRSLPNIRSVFGLDFGYTNDPSALFCGLVDTGAKVIYVFDEIYKRGLINSRLAQEIEKKGYAKERIIADSANPLNIDELKLFGVRRIEGAKKTKIINGVQHLQDYQIIIHPKCTNFITEINNYAWAKDRYGITTNTPVDMNNHLMDAMRYAMQDVITPTFNIRNML